MPNSLLTGISGLRGHQTMLEVIGNNLANVNTTGFKTSRTLFADLMYQSQRGASPSAAAGQGGVNPMQIGTGSRLAQIDRNFAQGNLESTGEALDLAIDGNGFFVTGSDQGVTYTRSGAFSLDDQGYLVDPGTGLTVRRFGSLGEPSGTGPSFQIAGDDRIVVPLGATIPGQPTEQVSLRGNLSSRSTGPVAEQLVSTTPWTIGGVAATAGTLLNNLDQIVTPFGATDSIVISGADTQGAPVSTTVAVNSTTTLGDLVGAMNTAFPQTDIALNADGRIVADSQLTGPSVLAISVANGTTNTGSIDFTANPFLESVVGKDADVVRGGVEVFDGAGTPHTLGVEFVKQSDGSWNATVAIDPSLGTVIDGTVEGIQFLQDGSFSQVTGTGLGDDNIEIQFLGSPTPQVITLSMGAAGQFDGLTEVGSATSFAAEADGFAPGTLSTIQVDGSGMIHGVVTNGVRIPIAQLAIATFRNPDGLESVGNNGYVTSVVSGEPEIGAAAAGGRGTIRAGQLEQSNVDLALEFTRLIVAQRGFSANARTITVTDEVLQELTNLIR